MSSAFVFGTMSFFDKILNGSVVVILEQINPYKNADADCFCHISILFYKYIVVFVSGVTVLLTILGVLMIIRTNFESNETQCQSQSSSKRCSESSLENVKY